MPSARRRRRHNLPCSHGQQRIRSHDNLQPTVYSMKSVLKTAKTRLNCSRLCQCFHCQCSQRRLAPRATGGWSSLLRGHEKTRSTHGASCRPARQRLPIFGGPTRQRRSSHVTARFLPAAQASCRTFAPQLLSCFGPRRPQASFFAPLGPCALPLIPDGSFSECWQFASRRTYSKVRIRTKYSKDDAPQSMTHASG
jgi:hypothetical protein